MTVRAGPHFTHDRPLPGHLLPTTAGPGQARPGRLLPITNKDTLKQTMRLAIHNEHKKVHNATSLIRVDDKLAQ